MTSMKSFELANLGTNRTVPLIGHETMSYLMLANGIWANTRSQGHEMNPQPFFTNLAKVVSKATAKIEAFLERRRTLNDLQSLDDRMLKDIGIVRADIPGIVQKATVEPKPSLLRRAVSSLIRAHDRRSTAMALSSLPNYLLRDFGLERGQIDAFVSGKLAINLKVPAPSKQPAVQPKSGLVKKLVKPIKQWNISRRGAGDMVRIDAKLLTDIGYVKGDVDWVPEVLATRRLDDPANLNAKGAKAA